MDNETRFLLLVRKVVKSKTSLAKASVAVRDERTWLSKALNGDRPFGFKHLEEVLGAIGVELDEFWREYLAEEVGYGIDTAGRLLQHFQRIQASDDPPELLRRLSRVMPEQAPSSAVPCSFERFEYTTELLQTHRLAAQAEAETWLLELWGRRIAQGRWAPEHAADLSLALSAWATIVRSLGQTTAAASALGLVLPLHVGRSLAPSFGPVLEVSARVLNDLGHPVLGLDCLREASSLYSIFGQNKALLRTKLAIGIFAGYRGMPEIAEHCFLPCIHQDDAPENFRNIALINLAWVCQRYNRLDRARELLGEIPGDGLDERVQLNVQWVEALILLRGGASGLVRAAELLRGLFERAADHLAPIDHLILFMDLAECLTALGEKDEVLALAPDMVRLVETLDDNAALAKALATNTLDRLAEADAEAVRDAAARFRRAVQPGAAATVPL